jgi:hypothetical protein
MSRRMIDGSEWQIGKDREGSGRGQILRWGTGISFWELRKATKNLRIVGVWVKIWTVLPKNASYIFM